MSSNSTKELAEELADYIAGWDDLEEPTARHRTRGRQLAAHLNALPYGQRMQALEKRYQELQQRDHALESENHRLEVERDRLQEENERFRGVLRLAGNSFPQPYMGRIARKALDDKEVG